MKPLKKAAITLVTLPKCDRRWVWKRLNHNERSQLAPLIDELKAIVSKTDLKTWEAAREYITEEDQKNRYTSDQVALIQELLSQLPPLLASVIEKKAVEASFSDSMKTLIVKEWREWLETQLSSNKR